MLFLYYVCIFDECKLCLIFVFSTFETNKCEIVFILNDIITYMKSLLVQTLSNVIETTLWISVVLLQFLSLLIYRYISLNNIKFTIS